MLLFSLFIVFLTWVQPGYASEMTDRLIAGEVVRVLDGDTIEFKISSTEKEVLDYLCDQAPPKISKKIKGCDSSGRDHVVTKIRFLRVDTPESNFRGQSQGRLGELAKKALQRLINAGDSIFLQTGPVAFGIYGRMLGELIKDDINVNLELVRKGWAFPLFFYPETLEAYQAYLQASDEAMDNNRGLFSKRYLNQRANLIPHEYRMSLGFPDRARFYSTSFPSETDSFELLDNPKKVADFYPQGDRDRLEAFRQAVRRVFYIREPIF